MAESFAPSAARRSIALAVGCLIGIAATLSVHAAVTPPEAAGPPPTTTTTAPVPEWFHPTEVLLGPVALVPERLSVAAGTVSLRYRIEPLTPPAAEPDAAPTPAFLPGNWTLVTTAGDFDSTTAPWTREVVFAVPPDLAVDDIDHLRIESGWIASPFHSEVTLDLDATDRAPLMPGVTLRVLRATEGSTGAQVVASLESEHGFGVSDLGIESSHGSWLTSSRNQGDATRWTVSFTAEAPEPLPLTVRGIAWLPIGVGAEVDVTGVPGG